MGTQKTEEQRQAEGRAEFRKTIQPRIRKLFNYFRLIMNCRYARYAWTQAQAEQIIEAIQEEVDKLKAILLPEEPEAKPAPELFTLLDDDELAVDTLVHDPAEQE